MLQRGVLMEAAVFEVHLVVTGRLDVVCVHLWKTCTSVTKVTYSGGGGGGGVAHQVYSVSLVCVSQLP